MIGFMRAWVAFALVCACAGGAAVARDVAPAGGDQPLQAIFIEVEGKARWRADEKADWKEAVVNDLVSPGAEIRTGLKGRAALRVGKNATVLVDAGTTFQLPTIVQDGETLRTLAAVKSGRVDFKVDKVGFSNDFKVLTPQTTLSVRGTGFGVSTGPLTGVEVVGARTNMIDAIELRYVTQNVRYFLSGSATSSSGRMDPVKNAWLSTIGPPQVAGTVADNAQLEQAAAQGQAGNAPTSAQMFQQIAAAQTEERFGSSVLDLLRLEERAADRSNAASGATLLAAGAAHASAGGANSAVQDRNAHIDEAIQLRDQMETAWSGTGNSQSLRTSGGHEARLTELSARASADLLTVADRRADLETGILSGTENDVTDALDAIADIDDAWRGALKTEVDSIVGSLTALNAQIQAAYALAETKDSNFNALFPPAEAEVATTQGLAATLDGLRDAVRRYQAAVVAAVKGGQVSAASIAQLMRSVEILADVEKRTAAALAATKSASDLLNNARSLSERVLLAAAFTATVRGGVIKGLAEGFKSDIDPKITAIELARFDAFYRSAEAGLDAIEEGSALAVTEADAINPIAAQLPAKAAEAKPFLETALQSADAMDTFWTDAASGGQSREARMSELETRSLADRTQMAGDLANLQLSIGADDAPGAALFIDQMQTTHDAWWTPGTGLVFEARGINDEMVSRMATVEQDWQAADSKYDQVQSLLDSAEARRDAAQAAAAKISDIKARMERYQAQYLAMADAGRGGTGAKGQVEAGIAALAALEGTYLAGLQASADAASRVETARSNAERTLYSAASNAYLRALGQAGDSAAAMAAIETNAGQLKTDYNSGRVAYDGKFPPGN